MIILSQNSHFLGKFMCFIKKEKIKNVYIIVEVVIGIRRILYDTQLYILIYIPEKLCLIFLTSMLFHKFFTLQQRTLWFHAKNSSAKSEVIF